MTTKSAQQDLHLRQLTIPGAFRDHPKRHNDNTEGMLSPFMIWSHAPGSRPQWATADNEGPGSPDLFRLVKRYGQEVTLRAVQNPDKTWATFSLEGWWDGGPTDNAWSFHGNEPTCTDALSALIGWARGC